MTLGSVDTKSIWKRMWSAGRIEDARFWLFAMLPLKNHPHPPPFSTSQMVARIDPDQRMVQDQPDKLGVRIHMQPA
jgi:hypothetical protein